MPRPPAMIDDEDDQYAIGVDTQQYQTEPEQHAGPPDDNYNYDNNLDEPLPYKTAYQIKLEKEQAEWEANETQIELVYE
jgi:hypothetical protein